MLEKGGGGILKQELHCELPDQRVCRGRAFKSRSLPQAYILVGVSYGLASKLHTLTEVLNSARFRQ